MIVVKNFDLDLWFDISGSRIAGLRFEVDAKGTFVDSWNECFEMSGEGGS